MFSHVKSIRNRNILKSECQTIIVTTNTVGVMGAGLAKSAANLYPEILPIYRAACNNREHTTELPLFIPGNDNRPNILCVATKQHWQNPSQPEWINSALNWIAKNYTQLGITSLAIPPMGCGLGGLNYQRDLRPLLIKHLPSIQIPVRVYLA